MTERILTYAQAIQEATEQAMTNDPSIIVMGIGVDDFKTIYGTTAGLVEKFGRERVFDTPIAEEGMTGIAVGMALAGLRPIHVHIRMDFLLLCMNQLINMAAKMRSMYGGQVKIPIVVRAMIGRSWGQGAHHSQGLQSFFMHVPGIKVVAPSTPYDAKGCLISSLRDSNPIIFVEHMVLHKQTGPVPEESYTVPFGKARIRCEGTDVTLVGISWMAVECMRAQKLLAEQGIHAEVIDPVSLSPLDFETIRRSAEKTGNLLVVDAAWTSCGASAEILARFAEDPHPALSQGERGRVRGIRLARIGFEPVSCPTSKPLENHFYPNPQKIAQEVFRMLGKSSASAMPVAAGNAEAVSF